jgi:intracellular sulfur oxidation DsrE/DsrF family protein
MLRGIVLALFSLVTATAARAQPLSQAQGGPLIERFGAVYPVAHPDFATPTDLEYRVVFDLSHSPEDYSAVNPRIGTLARFLNMHAQAGVPQENMELALVLHGTAGKDALHHTAYHERFGVENPNLELLQALHEAGVQIYLCGQTASHRGYPREDLVSSVELALSAMTVFAVLQSQGYQLNPF